MLLAVRKKSIHCYTQKVKDEISIIEGRVDVALVINQENLKSHIKQMGVRAAIQMRCHDFSDLRDLTHQAMTKNDIMCVIFQIDFESQFDLDHFSVFKNLNPKMPVILLGDVEDEVLALNLRQHGAEDYWCVNRLNHLDIVTRVCLAIERADIIAMLEEERSAMEELMDALSHGKINTIPDAQFPSGAIKVLDARLAEQNEALLRKIELKNKELEYIAHIDPLTELPNRRQFERSFKIELARINRSGGMLALIFLDLDNFKTVNDGLGHHIGDLLLMEVAKRIRQNIRENDLAARMAGDEFAILVSDIKGPHDAGVVANKLVKSLVEHYSLEGKPVSCSGSMGIACYPHAGKTMEALFQSADMAMYTAKESGRNIYKYYTKELNEKHSRRLTLEQGLRFAIEKRELYLVYQPQYRILDNTLSGYEVLVRWEHAQLGNITPTEFIPIAEEIGIMSDIGDWIIDQAVAQHNKWYQQFSKDIKMGVNISPCQLKPELVAKLKDIAKQYCQDVVHHMELELTESAIMADNQKVEGVLGRLSDMGLKIAIDDFGTGYSSLSHIQQLPIDILKIDRSFIGQMEENINDRKLVKSIIDMARNLNLEVIAEGIETEAQLDYLKEYGCSIGQGYYFAKPKNESEMEVLLKQAKG